MAKDSSQTLHPFRRLTYDTSIFSTTSHITPIPAHHPHSRHTHSRSISYDKGVLCARCRLKGHHAYTLSLSVDSLKDLEEQWDTFKPETLEAASECNGERPRSRSGFTSVETLESIEESRAARLAGDHDQYRALSCRTRTLLRRDKERYVRGLAQDVECHLNTNDLRLVYRALKKLHSKSTSQESPIRTADGCLVSDADGQMARWAEYFEQLFMVDPSHCRFADIGC